MTDPLEKVAAMRRLVVYYKETGHIYVEALLLGDDVAIAAFRDSDFPAYMQFQGTEGMPASVQLLDFLADRPEWPDLKTRVLDKETAHYDPLTSKFYNSNWQEIEPTYKEVK